MHGSIEKDPEEAGELVREYIRVRDANRGRLAAPESVLPASTERIAEAIVMVSEGAPLQRQWELAEAMVDLAAFIDDDDVRQVPSLPSRRLRAPMKRPQGTRETEILHEIRLRRAAIIRTLRGDPTLLGNVNALGDRPIPIGQAGRALDKVRRYRETQVVGYAGAFLAFGGTIVAAINGGPWPVVLIAGWLGSVLGVLVGSWVGGPVDRWVHGRARLDDSLYRRAAAAREWLVLAVGIGITIGSMVLVSVLL